jgi:amino acid adenylation domain-containing protein
MTNVVDLVLRLAEEQPAAPAVSGAEGTFTYAELCRQARSWAAAVAAAAGICADGDPAAPPVVILRGRGRDNPAIQLAAWLTNRPFLPLDPSLPAPLIARVLDSVGGDVVVTTEEHRRLVPSGARMLTGPLGAGGADHVDDDFSPAATALAYVIYTSGTTGDPKAVLIEHGALASFLAWYRDRFALSPGVTVGSFAATGFDASVMDVWGPLSSGAHLVVSTERLTQDPVMLIDFIDRHRVDHCFLPTALAEFVFSGLPETSRLKSLAVGGEQLRHWPAPAFPAEVVNLYGPTEGTVAVTATGDLRSYPAERRVAPPPIGRPFGGNVALLLDEAGDAIQAPGMDGELFIGGDQVALGYLDGDVAGRFWTAPDGRRRYATGDRCRWTPDGELEFVGRSDRQVKVRGHRIELGAIEAVAASVDGVSAAMALVTSVGGDPAISVCYVGPATPGAIRDRLGTSLPAYMVPAYVVPVPVVPLTDRDKVDYYYLGRLIEDYRSTAGDPRSGDNDGGSPESCLLAEVIGVWSELFGHDVGADDNFFELGGHSLLAVRATRQVEAILDTPLEIETLFDHPTPRSYITACLTAAGSDEQRAG